MPQAAAVEVNRLIPRKIGPGRPAQSQLRADAGRCWPRGHAYEIEKTGVGETSTIVLVDPADWSSLTDQTELADERAISDVDGHLGWTCGLWPDII